ncbi:unnamed protein product [Pleuronectes platessa]|uniref:Uncharacterized protein n=1 Tax=Pleuronectes platessa TaxID=8262 RepID=A0A9N7TIU7_PLEPL|nr:unnamed protein product [Pleuronectes platessa]
MESGGGGTHARTARTRTHRVLQTEESSSLQLVVKQLQGQQRRGHRSPFGRWRKRGRLGGDRHGARGASRRSVVRKQKP